MKYIPKPKHAIIQLIEHKQEAQKPGALILPNATQTRFEAAVLAVGENLDFIQPGDVIIYNKYNAVMIDEDQRIYSISLDGIICGINQS